MTLSAREWVKSAYGYDITVWYRPGTVADILVELLYFLQIPRTNWASWERVTKFVPNKHFKSYRKKKLLNYLPVYELKTNYIFKFRFIFTIDGRIPGGHIVQRNKVP